MTYRFEPLRKAHDLGSFACGNAGLDTWLKQHALTARGQGTRTYVLVDVGGSVKGYVAMAPHMIERRDVPPPVGRGGPARIPSILLAKLALDRDLQGRSFGGELLMKALRTIVVAARAVGGKLVVVDAIDENARRFYEHHDFRPLPAQPSRLVMKLSTVARILDVEWP